MMLRKYLPRTLNVELFGDRDTYGSQAWPGDPDWDKWLTQYEKTIQVTQREKGYQRLVNDSGYKILNDKDFNDKDILEIGPGNAPHLPHLYSCPKSYTAVDISPKFFDKMRSYCRAHKIKFGSTLVKPYIPKIDIPNESQDIILSFYSLEHLEPLNLWLSELFRLLRPGGQIIGAIPTEGGLAWGLGRWLTSRRIVKRDLQMEMKKVICWEHPNFCDVILQELKKHSGLIENSWPFPSLPYDINLTVSFTATKKYR